MPRAATLRPGATTSTEAGTYWLTSWLSTPTAPTRTSAGGRVPVEPASGWSVLGAAATTTTSWSEALVIADATAGSPASTYPPSAITVAPADTATVIALAASAGCAL